MESEVIYRWCDDEYTLVNEVSGVKFLINNEENQLIVIDTNGDVSIIIDALHRGSYSEIDIYDNIRPK